MIQKDQPLRATGPQTSISRLFVIPLALLLVAFVFPAQGAGKSKTGLPSEIEAFIKAKETHARALAKKLNLKVSSDVWSFFRTAQTGTITDITNAFTRLNNRNGQYEGSTDDPTVNTLVWQTVVEVILAVEAFEEGDSKYCMAFGKGVIDSIPAGSIYFGGTDAGRGLVTALSKSHARADPVFTITQNALADGRYLDYIRAMYGEKIRTPTTNDSQKAFQDYLTDAQKRLEHDRRFPNEARQIKPGEDVRIIDNRVQISGTTAVMTINGLLVKVIFDANQDRQFFVEESYPVEWMYPHLSPHGFIFKMNREPLVVLGEEVVRQDREFWTRKQQRLIGSWLTADTPLKDVCAFAQKRYDKKDFSGFEGERPFVENDYANKLYSKLRASIGGLYVWRATNSISPEVKKRMTAEADYAFLQAFALCPYSPETVLPYVDHLILGRRLDDAFRVVGAAQSINTDNSRFEQLLSEITRMKRTQEK